MKSHEFTLTSVYFNTPMEKRITLQLLDVAKNFAQPMDKPCITNIQRILRKAAKNKAALLTNEQHRVMTVYLGKVCDNATKLLVDGVLLDDKAKEVDAYYSQPAKQQKTMRSSWDYDNGVPVVEFE